MGDLLPLFSFGLLPADIERVLETENLKTLLHWSKDPVQKILIEEVLRLRKIIEDKWGFENPIVKE